MNASYLEQETENRAYDDKLLASLSDGAHQENAAMVAGCSVRTVQRRLADPAFRAKLDESRRVIREEVLGRLARSAGEAVDVLHRILENSDDPTVQIKAATSLLNSLVKIHGLMPKTSVQVVETREVKTTMEQ